jgi:predicted class III extradiol MEMO1 family dioxygenase
MMIRIREAVVAGSFYPADPGERETTVRRLPGAVPAASKPAPH